VAGRPVTGPTCDWGDWDGLEAVETASWEITGYMGDWSEFRTFACTEHLPSAITTACLTYDCMGIVPLAEVTVIRA